MNTVGCTRFIEQEAKLQKKVIVKLGQWSLMKLKNEQ